MLKDIEVEKRIEKDHVGLWWENLYPFSLETIILVISAPSRRSNQSILKKINPESSLEGLNLTLKLQHFGHLMSKQLTH